MGGHGADDHDDDDNFTPKLVDFALQSVIAMCPLEPKSGQQWHNHLLANRVSGKKRFLTLGQASLMNIALMRLWPPVQSPRPSLSHFALSVVFLRETALTCLTMFWNIYSIWCECPTVAFSTRKTISPTIHEPQIFHTFCARAQNVTTRDVFLWYRRAIRRTFFFSQLGYSLQEAILYIYIFYRKEQTLIYRVFPTHCANLYIFLSQHTRIRMVGMGTVWLLSDWTEHELWCDLRTPDGLQATLFLSDSEEVGHGSSCCAVGRTTIFWIIFCTQFLRVSSFGPTPTYDFYL